jgi:hypothetical protein
MIETSFPGWFLAHALIDIPIGYGLRVLEYLVWSTGHCEGADPPFRWSIMIAPQCLVIGAALAYVGRFLGADDQERRGAVLCSLRAQWLLGLHRNRRSEFDWAS